MARGGGTRLGRVLRGRGAAGGGGDAAVRRDDFLGHVLLPRGDGAGGAGVRRARPGGDSRHLLSQQLGPGRGRPPRQGQAGAGGVGGQRPRHVLPRTPCPVHRGRRHLRVRPAAPGRRVRPSHAHSPARDGQGGGGRGGEGRRAPHRPSRPPWGAHRPCHRRPHDGTQRGGEADPVGARHQRHPLPRIQPKAGLGHSRRGRPRTPRCKRRPRHGRARLQ
mmetsp:Transcript_29500/g.82395  ORF Transcript_29500/g.82395 Transcript_29500/m.82395 type:complete len:219 (+) Transcript_29500:674-1330(+)